MMQEERKFCCILTLLLWEALWDVPNPSIPKDWSTLTFPLGGRGTPTLAVKGLSGDPSAGSKTCRKEPTQGELRLGSNRPHRSDPALILSICASVSSVLLLDRAQAVMDRSTAISTAATGARMLDLGGAGNSAAFLMSPLLPGLAVSTRLSSRAVPLCRG